MSVRARVALIVQAEGAHRAAADVDGVARATKRVGDESERSGRKMRVAHGAASKFGSGLQSLASSAKYGALGVAALGVALGKGAIDEYRESYKVGKQTNAVLKSTGGAANISAKGVGDLANSLSLKSGIDDEAIQSGENLLLTFKSVKNAVGEGNDVFNQATKAALDMSVAFKQDMKSSTIQLGKALQDPIKGISALSRIGVSFTKGQKDQIAAMVKTGQTAKAQGIILKAVNDQVAGSAAAQADPIDKAKVAWQNLEESLGKALFPTLSKGLTIFAKFVNGMQDGTGAGGKFAKTAKDIGTRVMSVVRGAFPSLKAGVTIIVAAIRRALPGIISFGKSLVSAFRQAVGPIRPVGTAIVLVGKRIMQVVRMVLPGFKTAIKGIAMVVGGMVRLVTSLIHGDFSGAWKAAKSIVRGTWTTIKGVVRSGIDIVVGIFGKLPGKIADALKSAGSAMLQVGKDIVNGIVDGIKAAPNAIIDAISSIVPGPLKSAVGAITGAAGGAVDAVTSIVPGLAKGGLTQPGMTLVGEEGPEIAQFPTGTRIHPTGTGPSTGGVMEVHIHTHIDGKQAAHAVRRVALRDLMAKAPA